MQSSFKDYCGNPHKDYVISTQSERWGLIRQLYMDQLPKIYEVAKISLHKWIDVNAMLDWNSTFSPIERIAWGSIRSRSELVLYPQFPVMNYFIDFANPILKIGLELDGKEFHDELKDEIRDEMLLKYGWKIFRANGSLSNRDEEDYELLDGKDHDFNDAEFTMAYYKWMTTTLSGLLEAISIYYFDKNCDPVVRPFVYETLERSSFTRSKGLDKGRSSKPF